MRQVAGVSIIVMALMTLLLPHEHTDEQHEIEFHHIDDGAAE